MKFLNLTTPAVAAAGKIKGVMFNTDTSIEDIKEYVECGVFLIVEHRYLITAVLMAGHASDKINVCLETLSLEDVDAKKLLEKSLGTQDTMIYVGAGEFDALSKSAAEVRATTLDQMPAVDKLPTNSPLFDDVKKGLATPSTDMADEAAKVEAVVDGLLSKDEDGNTALDSTKVNPYLNNVSTLFSRG